MVRKLFFIFIILFSIGAFAQQSTFRETSSKTDDGILVVYPNPTRDYIILKSKSQHLKIKSVSFYSILGMQVAEYYVNSPSAEIRLDKMKSGKYFLRYTLSDDSQKVMQIIKL